MVIFRKLTYIAPPDRLRTHRLKLRTTVPTTMNSQKLLKTLRTAGWWFIALICLTLNLPTAWVAIPATGGGDSQFELSAQDFGSELLDSPVEPSGNQKPSTRPTESVTAPYNYAFKSQWPSGETFFLQVVNIPPRAVNLLRSFLPRPPPLS